MPDAAVGSIAWGALDHDHDLASDWQALEAESDGSPFTAWPWVSVWLRYLPAGNRPRVFRARDANGVYALGLFCDQPLRRLRALLGGRALLLQETGVADIDEITLEHGRLLVRRGLERQAYAALFDTLRDTRGWRSLRISASPHARTVVAALPDSMRAFTASEQPSYFVDLDAVRAGTGDYMAVLSGNTRYKLRRTRRAYEAHGPIRVEIAQTVDIAIAWLHELRALHQRYWMGKGRRGSFASAFFVRFHESLVREGTASGLTHIVRVSAGPLVVGYLYNLCWRNGIYFYNAGLNYGAMRKQDRPGYLAHHAAIDHYLAEGRSTYDFLAGEGSYKREMSTHVRALDWIDVKRRDWRLAVESWLAGVGAGSGRPFARHAGVPVGAQALDPEEPIAPLRDKKKAEVIGVQ